MIAASGRRGLGGGVGTQKVDGTVRVKARDASFLRTGALMGGFIVCRKEI